MSTCIGRRNRRVFVLYLALQMMEAFYILCVSTGLFVAASTLDDWISSNAIILSITMLTCMVYLISTILWIYQLYLISTNQVRTYDTFIQPN